MVLGAPGGCVVGRGMKVKGYQDLSQSPTKQAELDWTQQNTQRLEDGQV